MQYALKMVSVRREDSAAHQFRQGDAEAVRKGNAHVRLHAPDPAKKVAADVLPNPHLIVFQIAEHSVLGCLGRALRQALAPNDIVHLTRVHSMDDKLGVGVFRLER